MKLTSLIEWLKCRPGREGRVQHYSPRRRAVTPRRSSVPQFDVLEDRTVPATLHVHNNLDSVAGSLRATIAAASDGDTIVFDHSLEDKTITLTGGELAVNKNLTIHGLGADDLTVLLHVGGGDVDRVLNDRFGAGGEPAIQPAIERHAGEDRQQDRRHDGNDAE